MTDFHRILIVDDDRDIRDLLSSTLQKYGYRVVTAANGPDMQAQLATESFDLIVLDLMMPGDDGFTLCRQLRTTSNIPIIMLTAINEDIDRIIGLEMGADDYITKPFKSRELVARIKAVLRRTEAHTIESPTTPPAATTAPATPGGTRFEFDHWVLDLGKRELRTRTDAESGILISLTAGEFDLLLAFVEHPQRVLTRDQLLDYTKGYGAAPYDRSIDVQLSRLRRKIEPNPKEPTLIKTVRGGGYLFSPSVKRLQAKQ